MALHPCLVLSKAVVEEYLEEGEELVVLCGNDGVEAEEGVEVKVGGEAEGSRDRVDGCALCRGGREGADVRELVLEGVCSARIQRLGVNP